MTEADILAEVVGPGSADLSPEAARSILELRFSERATDRMRELLDGNNKGTIACDSRCGNERLAVVSTVRFPKLIPLRRTNSITSGRRSITVQLPMYFA